MALAHSLVLTYLSQCESLIIRAAYGHNCDALLAAAPTVSVSRLRAKASNERVSRLDQDIFQTAEFPDVGCLQGRILQGGRDEHCQRTLEPETGTSISVSHPWFCHTQGCSISPLLITINRMIVIIALQSKQSSQHTPEAEQRQESCMARSSRAQQRSRALRRRTRQPCALPSRTCSPAAAASQVSQQGHS